MTDARDSTGSAEWPADGELLPDRNGAAARRAVRLAAFDIDGTLTDTDLEKTLLLEHLGLRNDWCAMARFAALSLRHRLDRRWSFPVYKAMIWRAVAWHVPDIDAHVDAFRAHVPDLVRPAAREEMERCRENGLRIVLVTAAIAPLAIAVARALRVADVIATPYRTGRSPGEGPVREEDVNVGGRKVVRLAAFADAIFGPRDWRLARAYSDHHIDLPLLCAAERAIAVTPTARLRRIARTQDFAILDWPPRAALDTHGAWDASARPATRTLSAAGGTQPAGRGASQRGRG